jgi:hypothetical protein
METGIFIIMLAFSFGFMIWGFMRNASMFTSVLRLISITVFMGLALFVGSGVEVSATSTETKNYEQVDANGIIHPLNSTTTSKDILIPQDGALWMGWVFMGFGVLNVIFVVKEHLL